MLTGPPSRSGAVLRIERDGGHERLALPARAVRHADEGQDDRTTPRMALLIGVGSTPDAGHRFVPPEDPVGADQRLPASSPTASGYAVGGSEDRVRERPALYAGPFRPAL
ncbi:MULTISPECIES: hypothetical protein [Streptomyces]|uniref:Uncharacterized protein n=1 Tax=Streptomyces canarius TaxID=285453 RepID=A0ABQ3CDV7_9ACTN|nr:hypothetical protein [Streptomyces canarius]GHA05233.1 hypothetical protein GCM10010345_07040 [Streptomyces canarius]